MSEELKKFARDMADIQDSLGERAGLFRKKVAMQILTGVVMKTPVDTGHARGNWQVSLQTPTTKELGGADASGDATIAAGVTEIDGAQDEDIWIHNNVPYAEALERGSSKQAPTGMLAVTLAEVGSQFE